MERSKKQALMRNSCLKKAFTTIWSFLKLSGWIQCPDFLQGMYYKYNYILYKENTILI